MFESTRGMSGISRRSFLAATATLSFLPSRISEAATNCSFLVTGDWGTGSTSQKRLAVQMAKTAELIRARFVISTGDNFYPSGVTSINDAQWVTSFEDVYDAPALMVPWYVVLGNHDHRGDVGAQIEYTKLSSRWRLPARYYKHTELLSDGSRVDFFHLDTTPFEDRHFFDRQLVWLNHKLATSDAAWKIVIGHHPVYSGGKHGNTEQLIALLKPLFDRFGVQAYLNGHDHDLQHISVGKTHYLTSGAAQKARTAKAIEGTQFVAGGTLGFMTLSLAPGAMDIEFIDERGASLYRARIPSDPALTRAPWGVVRAKF
jgi:tartrate-resistant acid phosphatase type 5